SPVSLPVTTSAATRRFGSDCSTNKGRGATEGHGFGATWPHSGANHGSPGGRAGDGSDRSQIGAGALAATVDIPRHERSFACARPGRKRSDGSAPTGPAGKRTDSVGPADPHRLQESGVGA